MEQVSAYVRSFYSFYHAILLHEGQSLSSLELASEKKRNLRLYFIHQIKNSGEWRETSELCMFVLL